MDDKLTRMFHDLDGTDLTSVDTFLRELIRQGYVKNTGTFYGVRNTSTGQWLGSKEGFQTVPHFWGDLPAAQYLCKVHGRSHPLEVIGVRTVPVFRELGLAKINVTWSEQMVQDLLAFAAIDTGSNGGDVVITAGDGGILE